MTPYFQAWLIVASLALILSLALQIFLMAIIIRFLKFLQLAPGGPGLREILDKTHQAVINVDRAARAAGEVLEQINPQVRHAANISERRLAQADRVAGEVLTTIERINHNIGTVAHWPFREAFAWSSGLRSGSTALFKKHRDSGKGRQV
jgi:hypothetical protein